MDTILDLLSEITGQLVGRAGGPLNFRLVIMPIVVTIFAIRAGIRDAREGQPSFMKALVTMPSQHSRVIGTARKDIGKIFIVALVLDSAYQLIFLRQFQILQLLIVAITCAIVPYCLFRGPSAIIARHFFNKRREMERNEVVRK